MTLYEKLKESGCEIDNHQSDLYVKATPAATEIIRAHQQELGRLMPQTFRSQIDKTLWYDIPFSFDPFYAKKNMVK